jgi:hypothetical protein
MTTKQGQSFSSQFTTMLQEKKRMKITAVLAIALITVLIIVSSIYVTGKVSQSSQKSATGTDTKSSANAGSKDSSSNRNIETDPSQSSRPIGDMPAEHSPPINGAASNASSLNTVNNQEELKSAENDTETGTIPPPDGRIYTGGEAPYAYIPTCSQKERPLPIVPLTPVD